MYLIESLIFSALIAIINYFYYPLSFLFIGDAANPYQILSICMSVRYGSTKGFLSFAIIISAGLAVGTLNGGSDKILANESIYFMFSVLLTSHIAGQLKDHQDYQFNKLKGRHEKLSSDFEKCALNCLMLEDANKELTKKIVTRFQSLSTVYEAAKKLETLEYDKLFPAVLQILENHISVKSSLIYIKEGNDLILKSISDKNNPGADKIITLSDGALFDYAIKNKKTVSLLDNLLSENSGLNKEDFEKYAVVSPIIFNDQIYGILAVKELSFDNLNDTSVRMISMVAEWTGMCLNKINNFTQIESEVPLDQKIKCYKPDHLKQLIKSEIYKAIRYKLELSICKISIINHEIIPENVKTSVYFSIGYIVKNSIRDIDVYGACMQNGCFIIILPVTDVKGANILLTRLVSEINNFRIKPYHTEEELRFEAGAYSLNEIAGEGRLETVSFDKLNEESYDMYLKMIDYIKI